MPMDHPTSLINLPLELLELFAESVEHESDVNSLVRASRKLNYLLTPYLYRRGTVGRGSVDQSSALRWAATHGRPDTLRRAMAVGVKISEDPQLLAFAASNGNTEVIKIILQEGGFDVNGLGERNKTALSWAVLRTDFQLAKLLLHTLQADVNKSSAGGLTPFHDVVGTRHPSRADMARLLLENGAQYDVRSTDGNTPLNLAAENNDCELTELLLECGATPAVEGPDGSTPLHAAIRSGSPRVLQMLLEAWGDADPFLDGEPVLWLAADIYRNHKMADMILESGANVCGWGEAYTVMCECAMRGDIECVKVFVKHGIARPENPPDDWWLEDESPLTMAMRNDTTTRVELVRLLLNAGYDFPETNDHMGTLLHTAAMADDREGVELLLEAGANPMVVDMAGATPAHEAARMGHTEVVRILQVAPGADIAATDSTGRTPLFYAAMRGFCSVITVLLGNSYNVPGNKRDVYGASPIIAAARNGCRNTVGMLLALVPDSADDVDREGRSIAWWLEKCGCEPLPELTAGRSLESSARDKEWSDDSLEEECWCDVCTRHTVHASGAPAKACLKCYDGGEFIICSECEGLEGPLCDAGHEKVLHLCN